MPMHSLIALCCVAFLIADIDGQTSAASVSCLLLIAATALCLAFRRRAQNSSGALMYWLFIYRCPKAPLAVQLHTKSISFGESDVVLSFQSGDSMVLSGRLSYRTCDRRSLCLWVTENLLSRRLVSTGRESFLH